MPHPLTLSKLTLSKSRIEALSDGVFAIAMTLLVLKLEVPDVMHHSTNADMLRQLLAMTPAIATYGFTFLIAGGFWLLHHQTFHFVRSVDSVLLWINLVFLMFVSLLPFSAGLMSHLFVHPVSQLFYFGNQLAIALLLNLHWRYALHRNYVAADGERVETTRVETTKVSWRIGTVAVSFAVALATAAFFPAFSGLGFAASLFAGLLAGRLRPKKGRIRDLRIPM